MNERLAALLQGARDGFEVHRCLAGTGDAVEQGDGERRVVDGSLHAARRRHLVFAELDVRVAPD